jgi:hypothetical protein
MHSFLDKEFNTVYLESVRFCMTMSESEERDPFPGRKRVAAPGSISVRLARAWMVFRRTVRGISRGLG